MTPCCHCLGHCAHATLRRILFAYLMEWNGSRVSQPNACSMRVRTRAPAAYAEVAR